MENNDQLITGLKECKELIQSEKFEKIDFDKLIHLLEYSVNLLNSFDETQSEICLLKNDIIARISGMEKAVAAALRKPEELAETINLVESLHQLDANKLLNQYKRSQAKFRDAFPSSFGVTKKSSIHRKDISQYK